MKIEDLKLVRETNERLGRLREFASRAQAGMFEARVSGHLISLPKAHTDAIQALIVSGLRQQIEDCRKELTDRGVVLPEA